jgi:hypothetical protein
MHRLCGQGIVMISCAALGGNGCRKLRARVSLSECMKLLIHRHFCRFTRWFPANQDVREQTGARGLEKQNSERYKITRNKITSF